MKKFITFINERNLTSFIEECLKGEMVLYTDLKKSRPADKNSIYVESIVESISESFEAFSWGPFSLSMANPIVIDNIKHLQIYSTDDNLYAFGVYLYELWGLDSQEELKEVHELFKFMGQEAFELGSSASIGIDRNNKASAKGVGVKLFVHPMDLELKIKDKIASSPVLTKFFDNQKEGIMHTHKSVHGLCAKMGFSDIVDKSQQIEYLDKLIASEPKKDKRKEREHYNKMFR